MTVEIAIVPFSEELAAVLDGNPVVFDGRTTVWLERAEGGVYVLRIHNEGGYRTSLWDWTMRPEKTAVERRP